MSTMKMLASIKSKCNFKISPYTIHVSRAHKVWRAFDRSESSYHHSSMSKVWTMRWDFEYLSAQCDLSTRSIDMTSTCNVPKFPKKVIMQIWYTRGSKRINCKSSRFVNYPILNQSNELEQRFQPRFSAHEWKSHVMNYWVRAFNHSFYMEHLSHKTLIWNEVCLRAAI